MKGVKEKRKEDARDEKKFRVCKDTEPRFRRQRR